MFVVGYKNQKAAFKRLSDFIDVNAD